MCITIVRNRIYVHILESNLKLFLKNPLYIIEMPANVATWINREDASQEKSNNQIRQSAIRFTFSGMWPACMWEPAILYCHFFLMLSAITFLWVYLLFWKRKLLKWSDKPPEAFIVFTLLSLCTYKLCAEWHIWQCSEIHIPLGKNIQLEKVAICNTRAIPDLCAQLCYDSSRLVIVQFSVDNVN